MRDRRVVEDPHLVGGSPSVTSVPRSGTTTWVGRWCHTARTTGRWTGLMGSLAPAVDGLISDGLIGGVTKTIRAAQPSMRSRWSCDLRIVVCSGSSEAGARIAPRQPPCAPPRTSPPLARPAQGGGEGSGWELPSTCPVSVGLGRKVATAGRLRRARGSEGTTCFVGA
jgi:hypothetical protein